jgi:inositol oxygenase
MRPSRFFTSSLSLLFLLAFSLSADLAEEWEGYVVQRYADEDDDFRDYENAPESVKEFYRLNHTLQTFEFSSEKRSKYSDARELEMGIWEVIELLDTMIDESDPDLIAQAQSIHAYQTAEAMRRDGQPRWMILTGFIHDLGKILSHHGEPQWAVVGDTFPLGCAFSDKIVYHDFFLDNPDVANPKFQSEIGIYKEGYGLENVVMSWGHDEYLYQVVKEHLCEEALYMIRFHSFYAWHREGAYDCLTNEKDRNLLPWVQLFSKYDLYSKEAVAVDVETLKPYYQALVTEFFPEKLRW